LTRILAVSFVFALSIIAAVVQSSGDPEQSTEAATPAASRDPNEVLARVNGVDIKRQELDMAVRAMQIRMARSGRVVPLYLQAKLERDMLERIIDRRLVLQDGITHPPTNLEAQVQEALSRTFARFESEEEKQRALRDAGVTMEEFKRRTRENVIIEETITAYVAEYAKFTADDVKRFFDSNPDKFKQPEAVRASHILIRVPPAADEQTKAAKRVQIEAARTLVKSGEPFADVARRVSEDPGTASRGGDLGYFSRGQMVPEFEEAAFSLKTNELSGIITTQFGYHILIVADHKPAEPRQFDDVKDEVERYLRERKTAEAGQQQVKELRAKAKIEILMKTPEPVSAVDTDSTPKTDTKPAEEQPPVDAVPVARPKP